jgi:hypothetical protein
LKRSIVVNGTKYTFKRYQGKRGHTLPVADKKGKRITLTQQVIFEDENGTEVGFSIDSPLLKE